MIQIHFKCYVYILIHVLGTIFQLRLSGIPSCLEWTLVDALEKSNELVTILVQAVEQTCECGFTRDHITEGAFQCFPESQQHVTFRASLTEARDTVSQATSPPQLITYIEQWASSTQTIAIRGIRLAINTSCSLVIKTFDSPQCPNTNPTSSRLPTGAVIGISVGVIVVALVVVTLVVTVIIMACVLRRHAKINTK